MKIVLLNVKYSPNLGDGLLVECIEWALRTELGKGVQVVSVDLAGRRDYGPAPASRVHLVRMLNRLPKPLRLGAVGLALGAKVRWQLRARYEDEIHDADAVVVGGGNLLSDLDLNFPIKLHGALSVAAKHNVPVWVYGCGVAKSWSTAGTAIFRRAFALVDLRKVWVRDAASADAWAQHVGQQRGVLADVVRDPGLIASHVYPAGQRTARRTIGLGVIAPAESEYHGGAAMTEAALIAWFKCVAQQLAAEPETEVAILSNGNPDDSDVARKLYAQLMQEALPGQAFRLVIPELPKDLAAAVSTFDAFLGFRMHALIAAYSFGVPIFSLDWDAKVKNFMASINRAHCHLSAITVAPDEVASKLILSSASKDDAHQAAVAEAYAGLKSMANRVNG